MRDNCLTGPKYCPDCGKELETVDVLCKWCGTNLIQSKIGKTLRKKSKKTRKLTKT